MLKGRITGKFTKSYLKILSSDPKLQELIDYRIDLFLKKPSDTRLRNHPLTGKLKGKWAFSITDDIRIVYEKIGNNQIRFLRIGTHKDVYTKK